MPLFVISCSPIISSIEHAELDTDVIMSNSIFLTPSPNENRLYARITNTSGDANMTFREKLLGRLTSNGYVLVDTPEQADYVLYANVLFMDEAKKFEAKMGAFEGSSFGALAGAAAIDPTIGGAVAGWAIGAVGGTAAGLLLPVKTYVGVIDVKIIEKRNGKETTYINQIAVKAQQTRLDLIKAAIIISDKLADQVAAIFL
jgi:hypothetical protein